jgi:hypothetical protein
METEVISFRLAQNSVLRPALALEALPVLGPVPAYSLEQQSPRYTRLC